MYLKALDVRSLLDDRFSQLMPPARRKHRLLVFDEQYKTIELSELQSAIRTDPVFTPANYTAEAFDCDDYCMYLKSKLALATRLPHDRAAAAVGFIATKKHAFNFCINDSRKVVLLNTQSDLHEHTEKVEEFRSFLGVTNANTIECIIL